jgi:dipeptidyl aminopeptidase/acylaminoacyl peptidase
VRAEVPLPGRGVAGGFRFRRDGGAIAFAYTSALVPGDAWSYDLDAGHLQRLTVSPNEVDPAAFVEPELVRFASFDGLEVPAFVYRPDPASRADADRPLPVVVVIHGGPESQYRPTFASVTQYLVAHGFAVVAPNVRGSTGYGRRYQHLDDVEKRLDSVADLAALHDWLATQDDLDEGRAALYGGSYGGYMTLMGLALQPDRWAAGVDIVGMSDLVTFLENTADWRRAFREREYGSLEHDRDVLVEASPITHVDQLRAPLFIVHGANDPRVPLSEAEQIHEVLTDRGVRCELLVYEDEGHGLSKLPNRLDAYPRIAAFLHEVLDA